MWEVPQVVFSGRKHLEDRRLPLTPLALEGGKEKEKMGADEDEVWRQGDEEELLDGKPNPQYFDDACGDLRNGPGPLVILGGHPFNVARHRSGLI